MFSKTKMPRFWRQPSPNGSHLPIVVIKNMFVLKYVFTRVNSSMFLLQ